MKNTTTKLDLNQLDSYIEQVMQGLKKDRDRLVVAKRCGIAGEDVATLESIGQQLGITRERVRQIEKAALARLKDSPSASSPLSQSLADMLSSTAGIMAFEQILAQLEADPSQTRAVAFLVELEPRFNLIGESDDLATVVVDATQYDPRSLAKLHENLVLVVTELGKPVPFNRISGRIDGPYKEEALLQLADASKLLTNFERSWGLSSWPEVNPKGIRDKAYIVLKRTGKPMHFSAIARGVTELKPNAKKVTTQAVHNELIKDPRFVLIGRGIYALGEWGYDNGTVADIIEQVLKAEQPLSKEEIVRRVLAKRQVKTTTVVLNLQEKPQFERVGPATYKLKTTES